MLDTMIENVRWWGWFWLYLPIAIVVATSVKHNALGVRKIRLLLALLVNVWYLMMVLDRLIWLGDVSGHVISQSEATGAVLAGVVLIAIAVLGLPFVFGCNVLASPAVVNFGDKGGRFKVDTTRLMNTPGIKLCYSCYLWFVGCQKGGDNVYEWSESTDFCSFAWKYGLLISLSPLGILGVMLAALAVLIIRFLVTGNTFNPWEFLETDPGRNWGIRTFSRYELPVSPIVWLGPVGLVYTWGSFLNWDFFPIATMVVGFALAWLALDLLLLVTYKQVYRLWYRLHPAADEVETVSTKPADLGKRLFHRGLTVQVIGQASKRSGGLIVSTIIAIAEILRSIKQTVCPRITVNVVKPNPNIPS